MIRLFCHQSSTTMGWKTWRQVYKTCKNTFWNASNSTKSFQNLTKWKQKLWRLNKTASTLQYLKALELPKKMPRHSSKLHSSQKRRELWMKSALTILKRKNIESSKIEWINKQFKIDLHFDNFNHLFKGTSAWIPPLQTGHMLCLDTLICSPHSLHTQRWPQGIIIVSESLDMQIVHSLS